MNNITNWLNTAGKEQFKEFIGATSFHCDVCPAIKQCCKASDEYDCVEIFYEWAIKEKTQGMKLHLILKSKWFDMIASGEKLDEYRERTPYWKKRIWNNRFEIDEVVFHRGYTSTILTKQIMEIIEDTGVAKWGAEPGEVYYVIRLKGGEE